MWEIAKHLILLSCASLAWVSSGCGGETAVGGPAPAPMETPTPEPEPLPPQPEVEPPSDRDADGVEDSADNCPTVPNVHQDDRDNDGTGDLCQDSDSDGVLDIDDNCPLTANPNQADGDLNGVGNECQDSDDDGLIDKDDNCPSHPNPDQEDTDSDSYGDACDNCPSHPNVDQFDVDRDQIGDACEDTDGDSVLDADDNCDQTPNLLQEDGDSDGVGDICDNCPALPNPDQEDADRDAIGNACDNCPLVGNPSQQDADEVRGSSISVDYNPRPDPLFQIGVTDDFTTEPQQLGFDFEFFGEVFDSVRIGANGLLHFGDTRDTGCCSGQRLPDPAPPNNVIAGFWEDLDPNLGGQLLFGRGGDFPNREFVVMFKGVPHFPGEVPVNFQIILIEGTNEIEIQCIGCSSDGGSHTQGIEGPLGLMAVTPPGRNQANFSASNDAVGFRTEIVSADGAGNACDVCPRLFDPDQTDTDGDRIGDLCDICPDDPDLSQRDTDSDGIGDACDNCPLVANQDQSDGDRDGQGDACDE